MGKFGLSFSWKRALGITGARISIAKKIGVPTTKSGLERKVGSLVLGTNKKRKNKK